MRLGVAPWGESLAELVAAAREAEAAGADAVWVSELHRSAPVQLAAIAAGTSRVRVGTAIALAFVRSPMVTALEAMDLDGLADAVKLSPPTRFVRPEAVRLAQEGILRLVAEAS